MFARALICLWIALTAGSSRAYGTDDDDPANVVTVPTGTPLTIDGTLSESEWQHAAGVGDEDLEIRASHIDDYLQIGVRAPSLGVASICIFQDPRVYVFHASAALGRAAYRKNGEHWELEQGFEWRVRTTELDAEAAAQRDAHRDEHGWIASTSSMGTPGETEFQIASMYLSGAGTRLAVGVALLESGTMTIMGWPLGPEEDGSTQRAVIAGPLPDRTTFDVGHWATVKVAPSLETD